ncbi:MAG TPA: hypothetical protein VJ951_01170 [Bacteroidales bacterium]|nr:hypothetical protein [Bacteroidales bacterium]
MKNFRKYALFLPILFFGAFQCEKINLDEDPNLNFEPGEPVRVGPEDYNSTFSYYNTSPESPDGTMISYVKILTPQRNRYDDLSGELWVCNADLTNHRMIVELENFQVHNGVNTQWVDNKTIAYFDDGYINVVNLKGKEQVPAMQAESIGHAPYDEKILFSNISKETNYWTIYECDISNGEIAEIADASTFKGIVDHFSIVDYRKMTDWKIIHLIYSPDGSKIAMRIDIRPGGNKNPHLVTMNKDGGDIHFFGPKPMHFAWYDNESIMGHDNQINDRKTNDKSARRWTLDAEFIETLAGPGNHLAASSSRELIASESWYGKDPVVLKIFKKGETKQFWFDYVGDDITVWEMGNHVNPSFSRDGKRVYYHKNVGPRQSQAYMVVIPEIPSE